MRPDWSWTRIGATVPMALIVLLVGCAPSQMSGILPQSVINDSDRIARAGLAALRSGDQERLQQLGMPADKASSVIQSLGSRLSPEGEPRFLADMLIADKYFRQFSVPARDGTAIQIRVWLSSNDKGVTLREFQVPSE